RARARIIIARELRRIGLSPREHTYENGREVFYPAPGYYPGEGTARGVNLYAELPATMPTNDWIVIGGHYDTVLGTPGADDNASGVTAVLLVATELLRVPERRANLIFVFFDQEEVGLVGSDMFAQRLLDQGRNIITFHNIDMVGWDGDHDRDIVLMHGVSLVPPLDDRYMRLYTQAAQFLRTESGRDCRPGEILRSDTNRGEHITFEMHGIQAVTVIEEFAEEGDFNPYYHQLGDSCDRLDYSYLRLCADLVVAVVTRQLQ
ncbi:M28 family peptidase, partial [Patescibacteria group bacterium]|nr:M28 family peptidase [Patescibacteria group bacterium]